MFLDDKLNLDLIMRFQHLCVELAKQCAKMKLHILYKTTLLIYTVSHVKPQNSFCEKMFAATLQ